MQQQQQFLIVIYLCGCCNFCYCNKSPRGGSSSSSSVKKTTLMTNFCWGREQKNHSIRFRAARYASVSVALAATAAVVDVVVAADGPLLGLLLLS